MCQSLRPATLRKKRFQHWYFSVNFAKFLRTTFFYKTPLVAASEISFGKSMLGFVKHLSTWKVSVFSPNSGKLGPEKFRYVIWKSTDTFHELPVVESRNKTGQLYITNKCSYYHNNLRCSHWCTGKLHHDKYHHFDMDWYDIYP